MASDFSLPSLPKRWRLAWAAWALAGLWLLFASTKYQRTETFDDLSTRLSAIEQQSRNQYEVLLEEIRRNRGPVFQVGSLALPAPAPDRRVGWPEALRATTGADPQAASVTFKRDEAADSLVNLVLAGEVRIETLRLTDLDPRAPKGGATQGYAVDLAIRNLGGRALSARIPRGQVFENTQPSTGLQNLVAAESRVAHLEPAEVAELQIPAYCLNHGWGRPHGQDGNITPLLVRFEFADQNSLWAEVARARRR